MRLIHHRVPPSDEVLIDGELYPAAAASISIFDMALLRGYGCFEALRAYRGRAFRLRSHLDRLAQSAAAMGLELPARADLEEWVASRAAAGGDCIVRVVATAGSIAYEVDAPARLIVFTEDSPPASDGLRILPVPAPWHAGGVASELTGAKTLSYAPNLAASMTARQEGFDDALLLARDRTVLEGPTYSIGWYVDGVFETPSLEEGVLASITRSCALDIHGELGVPAREVVAPLERVFAADEVCALSTVKEVLAVRAVGDHTFAAGPMTATLAAAFRALVERDLALP